MTTYDQFDYDPVLLIKNFGNRVDAQGKMQDTRNGDTDKRHFLRVIRKTGIIAENSHYTFNGYHGIDGLHY